MRLGILFVLIFSSCAGMLLISDFGRAPSFGFEGIPIRGRVVYPDGTSASGAKVIVRTLCEGRAYTLSRVAITQTDGSFALDSFDPDCIKIRLDASHRERFWLPTGDDVFYSRSNGKPAEIELVPGMIPEPVLIRLDQRGGEIEFRVWNETVSQNIHANVYVERLPVDGKTFGSMSAATGDQGESDTLFLPPGEYQFSVNLFTCQGHVYVPVVPPRTRAVVRAAEHKAIVLSIDSQKMDVSRSSDNPKGKRCKP
jgi:hypothetical protein